MATFYMPIKITILRRQRFQTSTYYISKHLYWMLVRLLNMIDKNTFVICASSIFHLHAFKIVRILVPYN